ncbi:ABC transporter permease [Gordonia araii NBRC 100433]|nr:ABC transporter permease [Gordonia araii NBRC 100433]
MRKVVVSGEIVFAFVSPAFLAVCFYLPLRSVMDAPGMDYAQFLTPIILLQSVAFTASAAAARSSIDRTTGITARFQSLPMHSLVPPAARFTANLLMLAVSLVCGVAVVLLIGWRPHGGVTGTVALLALAAAIGALAFTIGDALGILAPSPQATSQILTLPILILGMVSTGFVPAERFPAWIRGFAEHQPISVWAEAMREFDSAGSATRAGAAVAWVAGLAVLAAALTFFAARKGRRR